MVERDDVVGDNAPVEFTYQGRRFRIYTVLARWRISGEWWSRLGKTPSDRSAWRPDDRARSLWKVEAAPIGTLRTFELERDEETGQWQVRDL